MPSTDIESSESFPRFLEELDSRWLSRALNENVLSFSAEDLGGGKGMMGDVWKLTLSLEDNGSMQVVAKFSARRGGALPVDRRAQIFEREIGFYKEIAPLVKCRTPRIFGSWYHRDSADFLILMEYIASDDTVSQLDGVGLDNSRQVISELAALHLVEFGEASPIGRLSLLCSDSRRQHQQGFIRSGWSRLLPILDTPPGSPKSTDEIVGRVENAYKILAMQPRVLCHADLRPDNILFAPNAVGVTFIDWQGVALGPQAWDVGYFLVQGLRPDDRLKWQSELIDLYLFEADPGGSRIDATMFEFCVNQMGWYSLAVACGLFTMADPSAAETLTLAKSMGSRAISSLVDSGEW